MRPLVLPLAALLFVTPFEGVFLSPLGAEEARARNVPYVTVRNRTGMSAPERVYGDLRGTLDAGHCDISEIDLPFLSPLAEVARFHIPEEILQLDAVRPAPVQEVLASLQRAPDSGGPVLYTHGFFVDFEKGCRRAILLQESAGLEGRFLWFSWPSDGNLLNYTLDEADLLWSIFDMAESILTLEARFGPGQVSLVGHSLGARGVVLALFDVAARRPDISLGDVILLAPDIDFDVFARMLPRLRPVVRSITVYVAEADWPLSLSAQVHGYPRLGQVGNAVAQLEGVEVIDLSDLPVRSPTGHLYHIYNHEVGRDMSQLLNEGLPASRRGALSHAGDNLWRLQHGP